MKNKSHIPATQKIINNKIYRKFSIDVSESELKWHWDEKDRTVEIVNDNNWQIQFDNQLPQKLSKGKKIFIKAGEWHRVIKGNADLEVIITEN